jgi:chromosome partitioning protein
VKAPFTVAVVQQKGGVGKTTLTINLAAAAHLSGLRTLVADMDRQGSAFDWWRARADGSKLDGLDVQRADRALSLPQIQRLSRGYDVVLLDGGKLGELTQAAAVAADVVLFPVRPGIFDMWAMQSTLESIDRADLVRAELDRAPIRRAYALNNAPVRSRLAREAEEALRADGSNLLGVVHQRVAFALAAMRGESVLTFPGAELAREEIQNLWRALQKDSNATTHTKKTVVRLVVDNSSAKENGERNVKNPRRKAHRGRSA